MKIAVKNVRIGPFKAVLAYFDIVIGDAVTLVGCSLLKSDSKGYYFRSPAKQRMKDGEPVKENGYNVWDEHFRLTMEKDNDAWVLTDEAKEFRAEVLKQAVAALDAASEGRGSAGRSSGRNSERRGPAPASGKPGRVPRPEAPKTPIEQDEEDDEDDELPFD